MANPLAPSAPGPGQGNLLSLGSGQATPTSGGAMQGSPRPGGEGPNSPSPASPTQRTGGPKGPMDEFMAQHDYAKSVFDTFSKARVMLEHMRREMDNLTQKGDTVQPPDVISAAGRLVGHGLNAKEMASILADMPPMGGQGLAAWLAAHEQSIQQQEAHAEMMQSLAGHNMMQSAFRIIAALHIGQASREAAGGVIKHMGALAPRPGGAGATQARPGTAEPGQAPAMTNVLQTQQRPDMEGPGAEEAV